MKLNRFLRFVFLTVACMSICSASTFVSVAGISGIDGSLPIVQGIPAVPSDEEIVATGGLVELYFAGYAADDVDVVGYDGTNVFTNSTSALGSVFDLGNFAAGTVITLSLYNTTTGDTYFTGPASLNPDGSIHSAYATWTANAAIPVNGLFVGLEDSASPVYLDDNDAMLVASGVTTTPEPPTFVLLGICFLGAVWRLWKRRGVVVVA